MRRPRIEVHQGRSRASEATLSAQTLSIFKLACVLFAVVTAVGVARVWLTNASMDMLTQTSAVASSVDEARALGSELEVRYYALTTPTRVQPYAAEKLGMAPASQTVAINIAPAGVQQAVSAVVAGANEAYARGLAQQQADAQRQALEDEQRQARDQAAQKAWLQALALGSGAAAGTVTPAAGTTAEDDVQKADAPATAGRADEASGDAQTGAAE